VLREHAAGTIGMGRIMPSFNVDLMGVGNMPRNCSFPLQDRGPNLVVLMGPPYTNGISIGAADRAYRPNKQTHTDT